MSAALAQVAAGPDRRARLAERLGHAPLLALVALVALPNLVFLPTHLASPLLAAASAVLLALALAGAARDVARRPARLDLRLLAGSLALASALAVLGGQAHLLFANEDWLIRDAVLADLVREPWPVGYLYRGDATMLRAPLGLYLGPALVGRALGLGAAHLALLAQSTLLFGSVFYVVADALRDRARPAVVLAVFVLFSGWDIVGRLMVVGPPGLGDHIEWWVPTLQFSSHVTQLVWVPNHAAAGWAFAAGYLAWRTGTLSAATLATLYGLTILWSPLAAIGALPLLGLALSSDLRAGRLRVSALAAPAGAALALAPVAVYLALDSGRVQQGGQPPTAAFWLGYGLFLLLEIGPALAVLSWTRRAPGAPFRGVDLAVVAAILLAAPLYRIGGSDFVMRASIPALALLALALAERVGRRAPPLSGAAAVAAWLAVGLGLPTPAEEAIRALIRPAYGISDCNLVTANLSPPNDGPIFHYLARLDAVRASGADGVLRLPERSIEPVARACRPDPPAAHQ